ncbi:aldehyde dehydrogenase [Alteribacter natronophilus]|uniref:aldehyde dehydrogenase n=1 Tax=Alteribacter natronophilus TaxID=2583810 RepID=UPI00110EC5C6|nr:aldehyde dehydrogenase [Alteribacter natronophilus]TMW70139.1 aldehyde dehydrogenase [Alteribacter natronophilus]
MSKSFYINGEFVNSESSETIDVINPATEEVIGSIAKGSEDDAKRAIDAAFEAQVQFEKTSPPERSAYLTDIADKLEEQQKDFAKLLSREQGKTIGLAETEIETTVDYFRYMAGWCRRVEGDVVPSDNPDENIVVMKKPIGVVTGIVPWNFPLMVLARKVAPAIATGCTVVIKPSQQTPLTAVKFAELVHEHTDMPKGVFNLITGSGSSVGTELASNSRVAMVSLTGSFPAGSKVMEAASENITKVNLELGGKAPAIVSEHADLDLAAEKVIESRVINSGQVCTNAERVYVHESVAESFIDKITTRMRDLKTGDPLDENSDYGPLVSMDQLESVEEAVKKAEDGGAKVLIGGKRADRSKGFYYEPTVLTNVSQDMDILQEEIFGPVLPIATYSTFDEAIRLANDSVYGLSSSVFSENYHEVMQAVNELKFGEVYVNREHFEAVQGYHAGWRQSGVGGADGKYGVEEYLQTTVAYLEYKRK